MPKKMNAHLLNVLKKKPTFDYDKGKKFFKTAFKLNEVKKKKKGPKQIESQEEDA